MCPCVWVWAWTRLLVLRPHQGRLCCNYNKCTNLRKLYPDPGVGKATMLPTSRFPIPHNSPLWDWKKYKLICQPKLSCGTYTKAVKESIRFYPWKARPIRVRKKKYIKNTILTCGACVRVCGRERGRVASVLTRAGCAVIIISVEIFENCTRIPE